MKMKLHPLKFAVALSLFWTAAFRADAAISVGDLRCENLVNPQGIDAAQPRLSWILHSSERGQKQTACEILVASSEKNLAENQGDLWSSGKIPSDQSIQFPYAGKPLSSGAQYFWKVRVWDKDGQVSAWSKPALWTMGLLNSAGWHDAKWIGLDSEDVTNYLAGTSWIWFPSGEPEKTATPATIYFRRVVVIPSGRRIIRAKFIYTGDNECRGWLNGFDLGARNNYHTVKDNDITGRLESGTTNVFGFTGYNRVQKPAGIVGLLTIEFDRGEPVVIPTDESWKVSDREIDGWNKAGFDDSNWVAAKKLGPVGMEPWGNVRVSESRVQPARYLRKEFSIGKTVSRATVYFSGLGLSELYLNGEKVGDSVLSPAFAQARVLCHLRRDETSAERRERHRRNSWQRPLLCRPQQSLLGHHEFWLAEIAAATARRIRRRLGRGDCQRRIVEAFARRTDYRQQRFRWRGIRRAQGISRLEQNRL